MNLSEFTKQHYNIPQLLFAIIQAQISILLWGRATGKSEGPMAYFTIRNLHDMPRGNGFLMGTTYAQLLTRTLPPLIAGWEKMGYYRNEHYWIGKYPDQKFKIDKAYRHPVSPEHYISWYNGSGIFLVSQDRPGTMNGVRSQWGAGDEAKLLNKKRFDEEVIPTMAGHADLFGHLSNYLSLLFCSDMPTTAKGKWLLDYKGLMDEKTINLILAVQAKLQPLQKAYIEANEKEKEKIIGTIRHFYGQLNEMRKDTVYFSLASTIDNIHALGLNAIKNFKRALSDLEFRVSILNEQIVKADNGFYGLLDPDVHGYDKFNYAYIDTLELNFRNEENKDCRWDGDINPNAPLDIACDYNNAINSIVTGQEQLGAFWLLSSKYVLWPELLDACVKKWHEYYKYHRLKVVNYYYDSTAVKGDARSDISFADEWTDQLTKLGWEVNRVDIGQIGSHHSRYHFWGRLLQGNDPRLPKFFYNKTNCSDWEVSAQQAGVLRVGNTIKKDKSSEKPNSGVPQNEATHLTEAADILVWGKYRSRFVDEGDYTGLITT